MKRHLNPEAIHVSTPTRLYRTLKLLSGLEFSTLVVCDIAVNIEYRDKVVEGLRRLAGRAEIHYVDHHPPPPGFPPPDLEGFHFHHRLGVSATQLTYELLGKPSDKVSTVLTVYGAVGDMAEDTDLIRELLGRWDRRLLYFEAGFIVESLVDRRDQPFVAKLIEELAKGTPPSGIPEVVSAALKGLEKEYRVYRYVEEKVEARRGLAIVSGLPFQGFGGKAANYALTCTNAEIGVAVSVRSGSAYLSLRTRNPKVDLNRLIQRFATALGGYGGGHPQSAAAKIPSNRLEEFFMLLEAHLSTLT